MSKQVLMLTAASLWAAASVALAQESPGGAAPDLKPPDMRQTPAPSPGGASADADVAPPPAAPGVAPVPPGTPAPPPAFPDARPPAKIRRSAAPAAFEAPQPPIRTVKTPEEYARRLQAEIARLPDGDMNGEYDNDDALGTGILDEARDLDLDKAMKRYQTVIARFDRQRGEAAQATFRLAECYRKLGRMEEAKTQYGRILREFAEQAELVRASERYLFKTTARSARAGAAPAPPTADVSRTVKASGAFGRVGGGYGGGGGVGGGVGGAGGLGGGGEEADFGGGKEGGTQGRSARPEVAEAFGEAGGMAPDARIDLDVLKQEMKNLQEQLARLQQLKAVGMTVPGQKSGYGFSASFGKSPALGRSSALQQGLMEAQTELDLAKANLRGTQKQAKEWMKKLEAITSAKPEHLPAPADADPQYAKLRDEYTNGLLNKAGDSKEDQTVVEKSQAEAYRKLRDYVEKIFRPAVQESLEFAQRQADEARKEVDEARAKVEAMRGKMEQTLKEAAENEAAGAADKLRAAEEEKAEETPRK